MKCVLFLTADYANISREGKLNVMGIFDRINAFSFPVRHPQMQLVLKLRAELGETSESRLLEIKLIDEDGTSLAYLKSEFSFPDYASGQEREFNAILGISDIVFPKPGTYTFVALVDGYNQSEESIELIKIDQPGEE